MNSKRSSISRLVTKFLIWGIILFSGISIYVLSAAFSREQRSIRNYTDSQMKSLCLDLDAKLSTVEAAVTARSHVSRFKVMDTTRSYLAIEQMISDLKFTNYAGVAFWEVREADTLYYTVHVTQNEDGTYFHKYMATADPADEPEDDECYERAIASSHPEWSLPYHDDMYSDELVTTCYTRTADTTSLIYVDVAIEALLEMIDSLQFYQGSWLYINVPSKDQNYALENGKLVCFDNGEITAKEGYTEISAEYPRLGLKIVNVVPKDAIYDNMWKNVLWGLLLLIGGLLALAFFVHFSFKKAQSQLEKRKRLEDEISIAADIQQKMLTDPGKAVSFAPEGLPAVNLTTRMIPAREIGGDLYEYRQQGDKMYMCIGDVSGKGVPASMMMSMCSTLFHAYISHEKEVLPQQILEFLNEQLCRGNEEVMFVTMWVGVLDLRTGLLSFASAGHNPPVLVRGKEAEFIEMKQGLPLGMFDDSTYVALEMTLSQGSALVLYTDGITEAEGPGNNLFGNERLLESCRTAGTVCPEALCNSVMAAVNAHVAGQEQSDDITMLCLSYGSCCTQLNGIGDVINLHKLSFASGCPNPDNAALVLEEASVNAFTHGGATCVCAEYRDGGFILMDNGCAFDPTAYNPESTEALKIGGRGILLMRSLCSEMSYERTPAGLNKLKLYISDSVA